MTWVEKNAKWLVGALAGVLLVVATWAFDAGSRVTALETATTANARAAEVARGEAKQASALAGSLLTRVVTLEVTGETELRQVERLTQAVAEVSNIKQSLASMTAQLQAVQQALRDVQRQLRRQPGGGARK